MTGGGVTITASSRWPRSFCGKSWVGAIVVTLVNVPVAWLLPKSGVSVPFAAPVVSMVLAQVSTTAPRSWFTGDDSCSGPG